ncbi:MAG: heavy-metal-associated domain-containing protein [Pyrinomonadaceae bacterium]
MNIETTLRVPSIVCGGCAGGIKNALGNFSGINKVEVDIDKKVVTVEHDGQVSREKLSEILDEAGFPVEA